MDYTTAERRRMAKRGEAMSDLSFPIRNRQDLEDAIRSVGRANDPDAAKRHIVRRARAMMMKSVLPLSWH